MEQNLIPVGATWEGFGSHGEQMQIWLDHREGNTEVWMWTFCYKDGSGSIMDWGTSYQSCKDQLKYHIPSDKMGRMKRVS